MLKEIADVIKRADSIIILPHIFLDGDAIGSALALGMTLRQKGVHDVRIYVEEPIPSVYAFLPGTDLVKQYTGDATETPDLAIALDTGDMGRLGKRADVFGQARTTLNIDHHPTNDNFAGYNAVMPERAAVGEIVHELIGLMNGTVTKDIAICLYVAIATDTGGFRFSNTTPETHLIVSELLRTGIDVAGISYDIFDAVSLKKVIAIGNAIKSLELLFDGAMAVMTVETGCDTPEEDYEGIVNIGRNISGVEVAAMFRYTRETGDIKVNLRSKSYVDVAAIASVFSGGGHKRAAGFISKDNIDNLKKKLLEEVRQQLGYIAEQDN